ncbi:hypothetical protein PS467_00015 [Streptomyces luomodiensis]|uniref:Uncharacterized protein n=1 Tax=Streptomyces luomodiensis TaxID=3026192 RepID=A0ABY9UMQ6_9ACTN|nr:hypothetical protein [Streptomyces sp. SCA4-21]WNE93844.1 hypothetical protein PS467_00015 [Streptomyces sp. SCA4-21]
MDVFEVGPSMDEAITETGRRLGDGQDGTKPGPGAVELFGAVPLDGVVDEGGRRVLGRARRVRALDLVRCTDHRRTRWAR